MRIRLILFIGLLTIVSALSGQDPHFTQFYANPLYLAPSFVGYTPGNRITTTYRNQWPKITNAYVTYSFAYDYNLENLNSGVGVFVMRDVAGSGELGLLNAGILYSYDVQLNRNIHLRPGIHLNYTQMGIDYYKLIWPDQVVTGTIGGGTIEPPPDNMFEPDIDFASSLLLYSDRFYGGFTVDHLLNPNYGLYLNEAILPIKYTVFGGYQVIKKKPYGDLVDQTLTFSLLYQHQDKFNQIIGGFYWFKDPIIAGAWYRGIPLINSDKNNPYHKDPMGDAVAFLIGYKIDIVRVTYSYDFTISNLIPSTGGSHEISLTFEFNSNRKPRRHRMVPCPFPHPYQ